MKIKLNVLLAKTDHLASTYKGMMSDFGKFFKNSQGAFKGIKKTYTATEGMVDQPNMRGVQLIQTTVDEKLIWFIDHSIDYIDSLFSLEKTNASGAIAELKVNGKSWGKFNSLELLRLKSIIENGDLKLMIENLPVRSDGEVWNETSNEDYASRSVWESPLTEGVAKTTEKESYILPDPNINKIDGAKYTPQLGIKNTVVELGEYTVQSFSGEISQREKALMLERRTKLLTGIIEALKTCNEIEAEKSELNAKRVFGYLFNNID